MCGMNYLYLVESLGYLKRKCFKLEGFYIQCSVLPWNLSVWADLDGEHIIQAPTFAFMTS